MLSVVEDFNKLKKYNIESILGVNNAGVPEQPKKQVETKTEEVEVKSDDEVKTEEVKTEVETEESK